LDGRQIHDVIGETQEVFHYKNKEESNYVLNLDLSKAYDRAN
jgi:hypothetical protein